MDQNRFKDKPEAESGLKDRAQRPCKFFLTEGGCKRGRACTWQHVSDGSKRCYNCGSTKHFAQDCPYSGQKAKVLEGQETRRTEGEGSIPRQEAPSPDESGTDRMKQLLEEANDMLQGFSKKATVAASAARRPQEARDEDFEVDEIAG